MKPTQPHLPNRTVDFPSGRVDDCDMSLGRSSAERIVVRITSLACYMLLVIGIGAMFAALYLVFVVYSTVPYWDEWGSLISYLRWSEAFPMHWVWEQNNEHRIILQKLLFLLDMQLFEGQEWPMFLAIVLSQFGLLGVFTLLVRKIGRFQGWQYRCALGLSLYCVFCPSQWENYTWGFQLSFVLVNLLFASALTVVLVLAESHGLPRSKQRLLLIASIAAAAAATFCNGNGPLVWPILIMTALLLGMGWRVVGTYALCAIALVAIYFHHYVAPAHHASPLASLQQPLQILEYLEKYFGSSFLPSSHLNWSLQIGAVGLTLVFALSFWLVRSLPEHQRAFGIGMLAIMCYFFLTAAVTALGRINFGTDQAYSSRYQSYALLFWLSFATLSVAFLVSRRRTVILAGLLIAATGFLALSAVWYRPIVQLAEGLRAERKLAAMALLTGVHDDDLLRNKLWPFAPALWDAATYLQQHRLSIFSMREAGQINNTISEVYEISPGFCRGFIDGVQSIGIPSSGLKIQGWAVDPKSKRPLKEVIFVTDSLITGYGISGFPRPDVAENLKTFNAQFSGWIGYAKPGLRGETIQVYGLLDSIFHSKRVCKIGQLTAPDS